MEVDEEDGDRPTKKRDWGDNMGTDGLSYLSKGLAQFQGEFDSRDLVHLKSRA